MNPYLRKKIEERAAVSDLISSTLEKCASENRDPSTDEKSQLDGWSTRVAALDDEIKQLETRARGNATFEQLVGRVSRDEERQEQRDAADRGKEKPETRSVGEQFVDSDAFKAYRGRGSMEPVEFEGFLEQRAAIALSLLDLPPQAWEGPRGYTTTTPLLDVLGRERVSQNSVEYITWGDGDPLAGEVPEGDLKPEADITPTENTLTLKTYAHWKAITRQALEDYARIRSIVEGKLRGGLANKLEAVAAATLTSATIPPVVNADILAGIRQGIGTVEAAGYRPNAMVLNPTDYANLDIEAAESAGNGPVRFGNFWGIRAVAAASIPAGEVYVGDFQEGVTWFDRNTASVYMTDSHADYFIRNLLVVLAEQRAAFAVTEPNALAKVTATEALAAAAAKAKA